MRVLKTHELHNLDHTVDVQAIDGAGPGGASHHYEISSFDTTKNPAGYKGLPKWSTSLIFQHGPVAEVGRNGITHESLLTVLIDRLECFQRGEFPTSENARALSLLKDAMEALHDRTRDRMRRMVEGKSER